MRLSDVLQDRLDTANKSRDHVMAMAIQKQKRIEELEAHNKELTLQLLATSGQAADALDKLTKAVEALRGILKGDDMYPWRTAREVLAELEAKE